MARTTFGSVRLPSLCSRLCFHRNLPPVRCYTSSAPANRLFESPQPVVHVSMPCSDERSRLAAGVTAGPLRFQNRAETKLHYFAKQFMLRQLLSPGTKRCLQVAIQCASHASVNDHQILQEGKLWRCRNALVLGEISNWIHAESEVSVPFVGRFDVCVSFRSFSFHVNKNVMGLSVAGPNKKKERGWQEEEAAVPPWSVASKKVVPELIQWRLSAGWPMKAAHQETSVILQESKAERRSEAVKTLEQLLSSFAASTSTSALSKTFENCFWWSCYFDEVNQYQDPM